jgi:hypothetical protein
MKKNNLTKRPLSLHLQTELVRPLRDGALAQIVGASGNGGSICGGCTNYTTRVCG